MNIFLFCKVNLYNSFDPYLNEPFITKLRNYVTEKLTESFFESVDVCFRSIIAHTWFATLKQEIFKFKLQSEFFKLILNKNWIKNDQLIIEKLRRRLRFQLFFFFSRKYHSVGFPRKFYFSRKKLLSEFLFPRKFCEFGKSIIKAFNEWYCS